MSLGAQELALHFENNVAMSLSDVREVEHSDVYKLCSDVRAYSRDQFSI